MPITSIAIAQSYWNFIWSMAVTLSCSVQNFTRIPQLTTGPIRWVQYEFLWDVLYYIIPQTPLGFCELWLPSWRTHPPPPHHPPDSTRLLWTVATILENTHTHSTLICMAVKWILSNSHLFVTMSCVGTGWRSSLWNMSKCSTLSNIFMAHHVLLRWKWPGASLGVNACHMICWEHPSG